MDELAFLSASELAARLARRDVSARELLEVHVRRIEKLNPAVNAVVTLLDRAADAAAALDERIVRRGPVGPGFEPPPGF